MIIKKIIKKIIGWILVLSVFGFIFLYDCARVGVRWAIVAFILAVFLTALLEAGINLLIDKPRN